MVYFFPAGRLEGLSPDNADRRHPGGGERPHLEIERNPASTGQGHLPPEGGWRRGRLPRAPLRQQRSEQDH